MHLLHSRLTRTGSAPLPPLASSVHPSFVIDAHRFVHPDTPSESPDALFTALAADMPRPPVKSAVQVKMNVSAEPAPAVLCVTLTPHSLLLVIMTAAPRHYKMIIH